VPTPSEADARKQLLLLAAQHLGVGTLEDLTDYHRQKNAPCVPLLAELVEEGALVPVRVEGWTKVAYLHPSARVPRRVSASALLSPFDPVVWNRDRAMRLYGFHYRIEIYTPAPKRVFGYYVLPILWGETLVGRLDLKADRANRTLLVPASHIEPGLPTGVATEMAADIAAELWTMARWLGLERVHVASRGDLASPLADAVTHYARR
jgi:uncharacterized protein